MPTVSIPLTDEQYRVLSDEARRITARWGKDVTPEDVLVSLVEMHMRRLSMIGRGDQQTVSWLLRKGNEQ